MCHETIHHYKLIHLDEEILSLDPHWFAKRVVLVLFFRFDLRAGHVFEKKLLQPHFCHLHASAPLVKPQSGHFLSKIIIHEANNQLA